jgi:hypothetical protein
MTTWLAASLLALAAPGGAAAQTAASPVPPAQVSMDERTLERFLEEIDDYVEERKEVRKDAPPIAPGSTGEQIAAHRVYMAKGLQKEWGGKKRGNVFKPDVEAAFRRILDAEFKGPDGPALIKMVRTGNPKVEGIPNPNDPSKETRRTFTVAVGAIYPDEAPFSTVPTQLLLKLPELPEQVRYRFVGRTFILRDTEANVILDYIPDVVPDPTIPR